MSYVLFPARTSNFYPPGPPYLAGMGLYGMRGLGDYAADLAAYTADKNKWRLESLQFNRDLKVYDVKVKQVDDAYAAALAAFAADKAKWDKEYAAYLVAAKNWNAAFAQYQAANTAKSKQVAAAYGLNLPASYYSSGACVTQMEHDAAARACTTVKGIGSYGMRGLGSQDPDCGTKLLPICQFGPPPTVRNQPQPPPKGAYPAKPKALRAMPVAPTQPASTPSSTPSSVPVSTPVPVPDGALTPEPADEPKQANVLMGGLIVAAIAVGGFLVYRTLKKPKAAA